MTKATKRRVRALELLGGKVAPAGPPRVCAHHSWFIIRDGRCKNEVTKMRPDDKGVMRWYCRQHDPERIYHEEKNRKKRQEEKRQRWKQMESDRKPR